jgi:hypothetical protein
MAGVARLPQFVASPWIKPTVVSWAGYVGKPWEYVLPCSHSVRPSFTRKYLRKAAKLLVFENDGAVDMVGAIGSIPIPPTI